MIISRRAINDFLDRDFNDYAWLKQLAREKILRELSALKVKPYFKTEPWLHQLVCFYIALHNPRFLFLLDMGLGKTKILADVITQLFRERRIEQALITVPRLINIDSWMEDLERHSDLEYWPVAVPSIEEKRDLLLNPRGEVSIIDYQSLTLALCKKGKGGKLAWDEKLVKRARAIYDFVGIDESHKLSNYDNLWFSVMRQMTKSVDYCYATTGTLFGKRVEDLWGQFFLVDRGDTFGENLGLFRGAFFQVKTTAWKMEYNFNKRMDAKLHEMIQHRSIRYEEGEVLDLPKRVARREVLEMSPEQREHYMRALEGLINAGGQLTELEAQWLRMRQITSGYLAWKDAHGDHVLHFKQNPKLDWLEAKIDERGDSKVVVCYDYTETGRMICERLKEMGVGFEWFYGGTKDQSASRRRFLDDPKCQVFVMNSQTGGTGTDGLQKVARYMIMYESPTDPITRRQTEKRIHRPGQEKRSFIFDPVMQRSVDIGILESIAEGIDVHNRVVNGKIPGKRFFLASFERA